MQHVYSYECILNIVFYFMFIAREDHLMDRASPTTWQSDKVILAQYFSLLLLFRLLSVIGKDLCENFLVHLTNILRSLLMHPS